jgi:hypothetical protein
MQMEMGWNRTTYGEDTWYVELIEGTHKMSLPWSAFRKIGWDKDHNTTTINTAAENAVRLNFRLINYNTTAMTSTFTLHSLGWLSECN